MAEVVGLVASVIGIAGLAGKIVKTTCKVRDLLEQVSNVPEELQRQLDQIQLLAPILAAEISDDGPPALRYAVCVAVSQCQRAAGELGQLATILHAQVHTDVRGSLRKMRAAKVVLQSATLAMHEKRLSSAIQTLMMASQMYGLAQQRYIIELQKAQPKIIITHLLAQVQRNMNQATNRGTSPVTGSEDQDIEPAHQRVPMDRMPRTFPYFRPDIRIGHTPLVGSLEIQYEKSRNATAQTASKAIPVFRARFSLPRWLSTKSIDSVLRQSLAGWQYNFQTSNYHAEHSESWSLTRDAIFDRSDSLRRLQSLIADGRLSVYDTLCVPGSYFDESSTLMDFAFEARNWPVCAFLATYDVEITRYYPPEHPWNEDSSDFSSMASFIVHYSDDIHIWCTLLRAYTGSVAWLLNFRRTHWPDHEFYDGRFVWQRLNLAYWSLPYNRYVVQSHPHRTRRKLFGIDPKQNHRFVLAALFRDGQLVLDGIGSRLLGSQSRSARVCLGGFLHGLCIQAFMCQGMGSDPVPWLGLVRDLITYAMGEVLLMKPNQTVLHEVLFDILADRVIADPYRYRRPQLRNRNSTICLLEWIIREQLKVISDIGIDLSAYGRFSESVWRGRVPISRYGNGTSEYFHYGFYLSVMNRSYGPRPEDWKICFRETTDEFAGDFWQLVEPTPLYIPGAWVDED